MSSVDAQPQTEPMPHNEALRDIRPLAFVVAAALGAGIALDRTASPAPALAQNTNPGHEQHMTAAELAALQGQNPLQEVTATSPPPPATQELEAEVPPERKNAIFLPALLNKPDQADIPTPVVAPPFTPTPIDTLEPPATATNEPPPTPDKTATPENRVEYEIAAGTAWSQAPDSESVSSQLTEALTPQNSEYIGHKGDWRFFKHKETGVVYSLFGADAPIQFMGDMQDRELTDEEVPQRTLQTPVYHFTDSAIDNQFTYLSPPGSGFFANNQPTSYRWNIDSITVQDPQGDPHIEFVMNRKKDSVIHVTLRPNQMSASINDASEPIFTHTISDSKFSFETQYAPDGSKGQLVVYDQNGAEIVKSTPFDLGPDPQWGSFIYSYVTTNRMNVTASLTASAQPDLVAQRRPEFDQSTEWLRDVSDMRIMASLREGPWGSISVYDTAAIEIANNADSLALAPYSYPGGMSPTELANYTQWAKAQEVPLTTQGTFSGMMQGQYDNKESFAAYLGKIAEASSGDTVVFEQMLPRDTEEPEPHINDLYTAEARRLRVHPSVLAIEGAQKALQGSGKDLVVYVPLGRRQIDPFDPNKWEYIIHSDFFTTIDQLKTRGTRLPRAALTANQSYWREKSPAEFAALAGQVQRTGVEVYLDDVIALKPPAEFAKLVKTPSDEWLTEMVKINRSLQADRIGIQIVLDDGNMSPGSAYAPFDFRVVDWYADPIVMTDRPGTFITNNALQTLTDALRYQQNTSSNETPAPSVTPTP